MAACLISAGAESYFGKLFCTRCRLGFPDAVFGCTTYFALVSDVCTIILDSNDGRIAISRPICLEGSPNPVPFYRQTRDFFFRVAMAEPEKFAFRTSEVLMYFLFDTKGRAIPKSRKNKKLIK